MCPIFPVLWRDREIVSRKEINVCLCIEWSIFAYQTTQTRETHTQVSEARLAVTDNSNTVNTTVVIVM